MPEIKQYSNPVEGLRPNEGGINAVLQVSRRAAGFFNQAADATSTVGHEGARGYASALKDAGEVAVMYAEHQEVSQGAPAFAGMTDTLGRKWDDMGKANPGDPMLAQKYREQVLEPELTKFKDQFFTDGGQKWANSHADALRSHMYTKTTADMGTFAANAVAVRADQLINLHSNTALRDPSSTDFLLKSLETSINGLIDSSPNLRGVQADTARTKLTQAAAEKIVKAGAIGALQKSADPEAAALAWAAKYPQYISSSDALALGKQAAAEIRSRRTDARAERTQQLIERREAGLTQFGKFENELVNSDTGDIQYPKDFAQRVLQDPTMQQNPSLQSALLTKYKNGLEKKAETDTPGLVNDILRRSTLPSDDPKRATPEEVLHLTDAPEGKHLTRSSAAFVLGQIKRETPEMQQQNRLLVELQSEGAFAINPTNPLGKGWTGAAALAATQYKTEFTARYIRGLKQGKTWEDLLLNPKSPDYIATPEFIQQFKDKAKTGNGAIEWLPTINPEVGKRRKPLDEIFGGK